MNIALIAIAIGISLMILCYTWYLRFKAADRRFIRRKKEDAGLYASIAADTHIVLTKNERSHYMLIGIGSIVIWAVLATGAMLPSLLTSAPFVIHDARPVPVTIVEVQEFRGRNTLSYNRVKLVANINGRSIEDVWTAPMHWFDHDSGETVDGEWYQDGEQIQLGVADAIHPLIRWYTIVGIFVLAVPFGAMAVSHLHLATKKTVLFRELSLIDKTLRVNRLKH